MLDILGFASRLMLPVFWSDPRFVSLFLRMEKAFGKKFHGMRSNAGTLSVINLSPLELASWDNPMCPEM